jgi:hypothetical protein
VPIYERPVAKEGLQGTIYGYPRNTVVEEVDEERKRESRERIREFIARNY